MAISKFDLHPGQASLVCVLELLYSELVIPVFQRPYDWRGRQVDDLIADLVSSADNPLFLGLIVLHREENGAYTVIDGQQRITSLLLMLGAKGIAPSHLLKVRDDDSDFFRRLISDPDFSQNATPITLSQRLLKTAYDRFSQTKDIAATAPEKATCIAYVAPRLAGATSLFERINLRGRDVSQLDLVKNRLIGWLTGLDEALSNETLRTIAEGYKQLYQVLNPQVNADTSQVTEYDSDRLLRVHWILYTTSSFSSSDRVIDAIELERKNLSLAGEKLKIYVQSYVDSLNDVARYWIAIQDPSRLPNNASPEIFSALNEFHRLNRLAELEPLIVAVMRRFGIGSESAEFIRLCTILSFRDALAKRRGNRGRSPKWTMARAVYQQKIVDANGMKISSTRDLGHHLFWKTGTWWSNEECKTLYPGDGAASSECASAFLGSGSCYQEFSQLLHYFFWEYGLRLGTGKKGQIHGWQAVQVNQFDNDEFWSKFRSDWDIEHIFPRNPDQKDAKINGVLQKLRNHEKVMQPWVNHLGNLTVVPKGENRGLLSNSDFLTKRDAMLKRGEVRFNELLTDSQYIGNRVDKPFWGPNNCTKRFAHLLRFSDLRWGPSAITALGVGKFDKRVNFDFDRENENEDEDPYE
jgi:hypothetical protein